MIFTKKMTKLSPLRAAINRQYRMDENHCMENLIQQASLPEQALKRIQVIAHGLVTNVRKQRVGKGGLDAFLYQYHLSSEEGIALMCLAEALLRIPDADTVDRLIRDKITAADWKQHVGQSESLFVNAATWALMLTGKMIETDSNAEKHLGKVLLKLAGRGGEPVIRKAVSQAMKILGKQFVMGRTIGEALKRARDNEKKGYSYSYDMLGEAARTEQDALRYFDAYQQAIDKIGKAAGGRGHIQGPGISVKLSALHPRYEYAKHDSVLKVVTARLLTLAKQAKSYDLSFTVDAEEANRLDLSLDIIEAVFGDSSLDGWEGFGLAIQSYQKRAIPVINWVVDLARRHNRRIMVRLIKGAYWDSEIKESQIQGYEGYPVFTRKANTDVSFLACAKLLLTVTDAVYPMFATHNAYSVAAVMEMAGDYTDYEFQCLHGMGQTLYDQVVGADKLNRCCRIYAPVGSHEDLLAYLVRRLLENGANSSFVNRIVDAKAPIEEIIADPVAEVASFECKAHPQIPLPQAIYGDARVNSRGIDLSNVEQLLALDEALKQHVVDIWQAGPIINGKEYLGDEVKVYNPANAHQQVGSYNQANELLVTQALQHAEQAFVDWDQTPVIKRAACLDKMAELLELHTEKLMAIAIKEAGKTIPDAIAEVREAVDFCRYYAQQAREHLAEPSLMPGPTGELNSLSLHGRGIVACISPWNFPLAIFLGQVCAALVTGNSVIAKPAEQTVLIAAEAVRLLHQAGVPANVIQLLPGRGEIVGAKLVEDTRIAAVMFTGSTETARFINQTLAKRDGAIIPLIAETGGQNAMIVDSSALPEQVIMDVMQSAFGSAGQRCSALRILFLQKDIAPKIIDMLQGAMAELSVGDPALLNTDVGPVIDDEALQILQNHLQKMSNDADVLYQASLDSVAKAGHFCMPSLIEINSLQQLSREVFGPVLHVIRYDGAQLDQVIEQINGTGYGLTHGIHSRINETVEYILSRVRVGNAYVNRNMIGAVVGVQPFGGEGLSGTGPKAGGPHYLMRLCHERTISINTTAAGGNASLMSLEQ